MMSKSDSSRAGIESKMKRSSVIMAASGTVHTTEEATVCLCDLDMFCSSSIIERITRGIVAG